LRRSRSPALPKYHGGGSRPADFEVTTWYGILAPAGTPRNVITRVNGELVKIMHAPELKEKLAATGTDPLTSTPEEFAAYIKREITKWGEVIRKAGIKAD
jgi:tripartite-type tricarboxylate transporter receptor subunit TctC